MFKKCEAVTVRDGLRAIINHGPINKNSPGPGERDISVGAGKTSRPDQPPKPIAWTVEDGRFSATGVTSLGGDPAPFVKGAPAPGMV